MTTQELADLLQAMGCPAEQCHSMAGQLEKRSRQLAELRGRPEEEALVHLLGLMRQGWAARQKLDGENIP